VTRAAFAIGYLWHDCVREVRRVPFACVSQFL